jgi:hypothetical protein
VFHSAAGVQDQAEHAELILHAPVLSMTFTTRYANAAHNGSYCHDGTEE